MRVGLVCSEGLKPIMSELLSARDIIIDNQSGIYIVEAGYDIPCGRISIVFEMSKAADLIQLLENISGVDDDPVSTIVGRHEDKYQIIPLGEILFFEARGNNTFCVTPGGEYRVKNKLYELEERLPQNQFIRVNKSFIVNIDSIREIIPWFGRRLILRFGKSSLEIEVSKNYVKSFKAFLGM